MAEIDLNDLAGQVEALTDFETQEAVDLNNAIHNLLPEPKCVQPPNYLRSIDAAMTLVPEGCEWMLETDYQRRGDPITANINWLDVDGIEHSWSTGHTPALALTAAALRARLMEGEGENAA